LLTRNVRIPQLHVRELQALLAVAETGTFHEAGRHLFLHASTVSKLVGRLERRLDTQLVVRATRGAALTAEGRAALAPARAALGAVVDLGSLVTSHRRHGVR
jgi:DNA-binding transcriptional LysR family regulator